VSTPWIVVTGLDGSGKTHVVEWLAGATRSKPFRLPYHDFVRACLARSGDGSQFGDAHTDRLLFALDGRLANYEIANGDSRGLGWCRSAAGPTTSSWAQSRALPVRRRRSFSGRHGLGFWANTARSNSSQFGPALRPNSWGTAIIACW
jgi:hypothetical protein